MRSGLRVCHSRPRLFDVAQVIRRLRERPLYPQPAICYTPPIVHSSEVFLIMTSEQNTPDSTGNEPILDRINGPCRS